MNKKIEIEIAAGIILIIAVIVGGFIWLGSRQMPVQKQSSTEKDAPDRQNSIQATPKKIPDAAADQSEFVDAGDNKADFIPSGKEETNDDYLPEGCPHDPQDDPILGDCAEDCNTDNWNVYRNKKYGYSFRYPNNFKLTNNCKNIDCLTEEQGGDLVRLSGDLSESGWPLIEIAHLSTEHYNPPAGTDITKWIKEKFSWTADCFPKTANIYFTIEDGHLMGGFNIFIPQSPQAYSRREIYYKTGNQLFKIMMLDVVEPQARQFYNIWLSTFSVIGED